MKWLHERVQFLCATHLCIQPVPQHPKLSDMLAVSTCSQLLEVVIMIL
jgi:hypothetical protein